MRGLTAQPSVMVKSARPHSLGIGIGVLNDRAAKAASPQGFAASSFVPQVLAARWEGRKTRQSKGSARSLVRQSCRAASLIGVRLAVVSTTELEPIMADLPLGDSAQLTPFSFNGDVVRVVQRDGASWFVAKDVCDALGYRNTSDAIATHLDDDERYSQQLDRGGSLVLINESGLYALVLRSRKPEARKFAKWVTSEVLPTLRKTGHFTAKAAPTAPTPAPAPSLLPAPTAASPMVIALAKAIKARQLPQADVAMLAEVCLQQMYLAVAAQPQGVGPQIASAINRSMSATDLWLVHRAVTQEVHLRAAVANDAQGAMLQPDRDPS